MKNTTQKGFIIPLLVAIVAILAIGGGVYAYHEEKVAETQTQPSENTAMNATTSIVAATNIPATNITWKTYTDTNFGFTISYPSNWIVQPNIVTGTAGLDFCPPELTKDGACENNSNSNGSSMSESGTIAPIQLLPYATASTGSGKTILATNISNKYGTYQLELYLAKSSYEMVYNQMVKSFKVTTVASSDWKTYTNNSIGFSIKYPSYLSAPLENGGSDLDVTFGDNTSIARVELQYLSPSSNYTLQTFTTTPWAHTATDTYTSVTINGKKAARYDLVSANYARGSEAGDAPSSYTRVVQYGIPDSKGGFLSFVYSKGFTSKAAAQAADMSDADTMASSIILQ